MRKPINPFTFRTEDDPTVRKYILAEAAERAAREATKMIAVRQKLVSQRHSTSVSELSRKAQVRIARRRREQKAERYSNRLAQNAQATAQLLAELAAERNAK